MIMCALCGVEIIDTMNYIMIRSTGSREFPGYIIMKSVFRCHCEAATINWDGDM